MKPIPYSELAAALREFHPALHCEFYDNYRSWFTGEETLDAKFYRTNGCAVVYNAYEYEDIFRIYVYIHELSDDCDFAGACRLFKEMADTDAAAHEKSACSVLLFHCGALSDRLNEFQGFRKFVRVPGENAEVFVPDPHVVPLTRENAGEMKEICDPAVLGNDSWFGKREAESFFGWNFDWGDSKGIRMLGYRDDDGKLLGIASWSAEDELNLGWLHDIFVSPEGRGRGIGKALVRSALSRLPDRAWNYQAARDNAPSIALAKSCGFFLHGAALCIYDS